MKNYLLISLSLMFVVISFATSITNASEVIGTLSSDASKQDSITGTVTGGLDLALTSTVGSSGGGGGGSIVVPSSSYSYGNNVVYGTQPVAIATMDTSSYTGMGGQDLSAGQQIGFERSRLAQSEYVEPVSDMGSDTDEISTSTDATSTLIDETTDPIENPMMDPQVEDVGTYDFFGVSVWFWLILLLLFILIIAVLYMQAL